MTYIDIDTALAVANPLTERTAAALPLHEAERELMQTIISIQVRPRVRRPSVAARRRRRAGLVLAITVGVAALLMLLPSADRSGGPAPAFAASLVRFANASPLVLLQLPGWHVVYANEEAGGFGEMHFVRGPADAEGNPRGADFSRQASLAGREASLTWMPLRTRGAKLMLGGHQNAPTGLGVVAHRFVFEGGSPRAFDITALFVDRGRVLSFRATVTSMAMFRSELEALTAVDTTTWLRAMPPSVVNAADSGEVVRLMLKDIPLPPGFDAARIRGVRLVHDRYQLGAAVTGTVACMWIGDWNRGRRTGDTALVRRAIAAMATAPRWPILREMAHQGAWPQVLIEYAKGLPSNSIQLDSREPIMSSGVDSALGCSAEWGVNLNTGRQASGALRTRRLVPAP
ncbi:MAG TPA: hypothetical protein VKR21_09875 [Solirubrobacteraceae bacterium]|nr:hypothetical protein [Solirubrobacteraceae bacterium]